MAPLREARAVWRPAVVALLVLAACSGSAEEGNAGPAFETLPASPLASADKVRVYAAGDTIFLYSLATGEAAALVDGEWTTAPRSPLRRRNRASIVATDRGLFVWGGADLEVGQPSSGARYDTVAAIWEPGSPWRLVVGAPIEPRQGAAAAWTGTEVVVLGGARADGAPGGPIQAPGVRELRDGAAYDPSADSWRLLPDVPTGAASVIWTGSGLVLSVPALGNHELHALTADGSGWEALPRHPSIGSIVGLGDGRVMTRTIDDDGVTEVGIWDDGWESFEAPTPSAPKCSLRAAQHAGSPALVDSCTGTTHLLDELAGTWETVPLDLATGATGWAGTATGAGRLVVLLRGPKEQPGISVYALE